MQARKSEPTKLENRSAAVLCCLHAWRVSLLVSFSSSSSPSDQARSRPELDFIHPAYEARARHTSQTRPPFRHSPLVPPLLASFPVFSLLFSPFRVSRCHPSSTDMRTRPEETHSTPYCQRSEAHIPMLTSVNHQTVRRADAEPGICPDFNRFLSYVIFSPTVCSSFLLKEVVGRSQ